MGPESREETPGVVTCLCREEHKQGWTEGQRGSLGTVTLLLNFLGRARGRKGGRRVPVHLLRCPLRVIIVMQPDSKAMSHSDGIL